MTLKEGTVCVSAPPSLAVSRRSLPEFLVKNICSLSGSFPEVTFSSGVGRGLQAGRASGEKNGISGTSPQRFFPFCPTFTPTLCATRPLHLLSPLVFLPPENSPWKVLYSRCQLDQSHSLAQTLRRLWAPSILNIVRSHREPQTGNLRLFACDLAPAASGWWEAVLLSWMPVQTETAEGALSLLLSPRGRKPGNRLSGNPVALPTGLWLWEIQIY